MVEATFPTTAGELREVFKERGYTVKENDNKDRINVVTFKGWEVCVSWSETNYCCNYVLAVDEPPLGDKSWNAEILIADPYTGKPLRFEGWTDDVKGWVPIPEILRIVDYLESN